MTIDGILDYVEEYTYNEAGQVISVTQHGNEGGNTVAEKRADFIYNDAGQILSIDRYLGDQLVATSDYTYNDLRQLISLVHHQDSTILNSYAWTYDNTGLDETMLAEKETFLDTLLGLTAPFGQWMLPVHDTSNITQTLWAASYADLGNIMSMESADGTVSYTYDPTGQLTGATYSDDILPDEQYTYDTNGNRTNDGYVTGADNRLLSDGTYAYLYDAEGNRTARFIDVNQNGLLDTGDTDITEYAWDARNRLITVTNRDTADGPATQVVDYLYDVEDRWIGEDIDYDADGIIDHKTRFAYNGTQIILQFDKEGDGDVAVSDLSHRYFWQPNAVDQLMADEQVETLTEAGDVLVALPDHLGTIRDLAAYDPETTETTVVNHRVYDSFGNLESQTNAAAATLFAFTGRPLDTVTALQNNYHRWYDANVGKWISQDPIGFMAGDTNISRYCGNNSTNTIDPTGLQGPPMFLGRPPGTPKWHIRAADVQNTTLQGGQDVTLVLTAGLKVFNAILGDLSIPEIQSISIAATNPLQGSWDIRQFCKAGNAGNTLFVQDDPTSKHEPALGTVTLKGGVYWAADVNYVLWGLVHGVYAQKCNDKGSAGMFTNPSGEEVTASAKALVWGHRAILHGPTGFNDALNTGTLPMNRSRGPQVGGRMAFTEVGLNGLRWDLASSWNLDGTRPDGEPRKCVPSVQEYNGELYFNFGGTQESNNLVSLTIKKLPDKNAYYIRECTIPGMSQAEAKIKARSYLESLGFKHSLP